LGRKKRAEDGVWADEVEDEDDEEAVAEDGVQNDEGIYTDNLFNNFMSKSNKSYETKPTAGQQTRADVVLRFGFGFRFGFAFGFGFGCRRPQFGSVQFASDRANEFAPGVDLVFRVYGLS